MPKRFTATEKWTDPWFCGLTDNEKLFWLYLLDNCNHAGIWEPNWFMFGVYVKNFVFKPEHFKDRILELGKKWFIPKFIDFQYGGMDKLNPENKAHASVLSLLEKEGATKPLASPYVGAMDKDMVKDKEKTLSVKDTNKYKDKRFIKPTLQELTAHIQAKGSKVSPERFLAYYDSKGWLIGKAPMKDWKAAVRTWDLKDKTDRPLTDIEREIAHNRSKGLI